MSWTDHAIWWQVYPLGATGAPIHDADAGSPQVEHRLGRLHDWLDYAVRLGASGLALGPVFASRTHGYDTLDHYRIDPRLGDDGDFDALVRACHDRGLQVMLDGVFNHVSAQHPLARQGIADGRHSAAGRLLRWQSDDRLACFEGHAELVTLNHDEPAVVEFVASVMKHWLARGADAWRLDAAYAVPEAFWAQVLGKVRAEFPGAGFLGEVIHGDYVSITARSGIDTLTQYELWKGIWSALLDGNFFELSWALQRHNGFLEHFVPATFVGNHDVTRIATQVGPDKAVLALVVLLTVGGMPSVYYGDEQAFRGTKQVRFGGDDEIRPALPDSPDALAPHGWWMFDVHQQLIGVRRRNPWLTTARTTVQHLERDHLVYRSSAADDLHATAETDNTEGTVDGPRLEVELDLRSGVRAVVRERGQVVFDYTR